jgi:hypothetical protein
VTLVCLPIYSNALYNGVRSNLTAIGFFKRAITVSGNFEPLVGRLLEDPAVFLGE